MHGMSLHPISPPPEFGSLEMMVDIRGWGEIFDSIALALLNCQLGICCLLFAVRCSKCPITNKVSLNVMRPSSFYHCPRFFHTRRFENIPCIRGIITQSNYF